ncbi:MAG: S9 family peptidase [Leptolyngbya sp. SIO3F4]|nr:S9 family peptidase [Leptolyngbya sp. SIO3F4]
MASSRTYSIEEFLGTTNYRGSSFSPDNRKVLVSNDASGIYNAYAIHISDRTLEQLTYSTTDSIYVIGYFTGDERFLYSSDRGGNELSHVYVQAPDGTVTDLTPGEDLKAFFAGWAQDDQSFFVCTNERNQRFFDVYEYDASSYKRELIYQNDSGYDFRDITPDRRYIALAKTETNADSDIYLCDRTTGNLEKITPHKGDINHRPMGFTPDGQHLYYTTDKDSEFLYLMCYTLADGDRQKIETADWDINYAYFSKQGKYLVMGINNDARTELRVYDAATMEAVTLPQLPDAEISSVTISRSEDRMAFYASNSKMPRDLFVYDFSSQTPVCLTQSLNNNIDSQDLVAGKVIRFASYDGLEIPGILYTPHQASKETKVPGLVWVHGGPGGQSRVGYSALIQYLVNHGYAIYAINNRGSSGYGKTFYHLDDRKHGDVDLKDVVASKQMLIETGLIDPERIGIIGGSYGGYMVLAALAFQPEVFDVGIDIFGVSNWVRTLQSIPPWWESRRKALEQEMGDFDDVEFLKAKSPLFHTEHIVKPLMVLQGANDPRVLKVESDEIVEAVQSRGIPVEYVVFEDEGHGFVKKENQARGYKAILDFVTEYLS